MNRITISLPEEAAALLARRAEREKTSVSAVVRSALDAYLGVSAGRSTKLPFASLGKSGQRHTGRDAEEILAREWGRGDVRRR